MPPSPVSWAKPPSFAPVLRARTALADREPKLIAETLSRDMSYGSVQSGPPTRTRGGSVRTGCGAMDGVRYSLPGRWRSSSVPNGSSASVPLARW